MLLAFFLSNNLLEDALKPINACGWGLGILGVGNKPVMEVGLW